MVAAAKRGEDVVIARSGRPEVRLVPVDDIGSDARAAEHARRASAFGLYRHSFNDKGAEALMAPLSESELGL